jgi:hypothetical protein
VPEGSEQSVVRG